MEQTDCRWFNGYKPCGKNNRCDASCPFKSRVSHRILVVHLEALGAVLRATSLLPALRRLYPQAQITWLTKSPADQLLLENPYVDRVFTLNFENLLALENMSFDVAFCVDKSLVATGALKRLRVKEWRGFTANEQGAILPANPQAEELWRLGLDDELKFFKNQKPETQLMHEALALGEFRRDPYVLRLSTTELKVAELRRRLWAPQGQTLIGLNTGCASVIPYKKMSVQAHRELIEALLKWTGARVVLLGGKEDVSRNCEIAQGLDVILSPMESGLRDGLCSIEACDLVVTGDSLGMHMAIALEKWVVAWFGPTCAQEIDLFGRGEKVLAQVGCGPCWKRSCHKEVMCYDRVPLDQLLSALRKGLKWKSSSSKPPSWEISSSASP
jgi:heptosyltransferase-2